MTSNGAPRRGSAWRRALGRVALSILRWRILGDVPPIPKFVAVVAPHTSNWDFIVCVASMFAIDVDVRWLGKHTLFRKPLGWLLRWLGGVPIQRDAAEGVVEQVAAVIRAEKEIILAVTPEGTRNRVPQWKTGFHRIAAAADVPIVPVQLDWSRREVRIREPVLPGNDVAGDIAALQTLFSPDMARHPDGFWGETT